jgi:homoserine dehydrogenase
VADKASGRARKIVNGKAIVTADAHQVTRAKDVDIVVELIGGTTIAKALVLDAIEHGKHVVTANKALLANHGNEIFAAAQRKQVTVAFEAAVCGGVPIIKALREGLSANRIEWIAGIINGTSNFILSEMRDKGLPFASALKDAQKRGYAEADPTFDIEGIDAAHKLTILSALAFGIPMQFASAYTEGISTLTREDIQYAEQLGYRIKLLGITRRAAKGIELRVHPTLVPARRLIANVEGVMNAVLVKGDAVGPTLYYGAGRRQPADGERGGRRSHRCHPPDYRGPGSTGCRTLRSSPIASRTTGSCRSAKWRRRTTCACGSSTAPACSPTSPGSSRIRRSRSMRWCKGSRARASGASTSSCSRTSRSRRTSMRRSRASRSCRACPGKVTRIRLEALL